jgi:hypothetical protein
MRIRIVSLLVIALLAACVLNVAAVSATTPAHVDNTLSIYSGRHEWDEGNVSCTTTWVGGTLYFSGYFFSPLGVSHQYGALIDNGYQICNFYTEPDGSWGPYAITFQDAGTHWVSVGCGGLGATLYIQVYPA